MRYTHIYIIVCCCITGIVSSFSSELKSKNRTKNDTIVSLASNNIIEARDTIGSNELPKEYQTLKEQSSKNKWTKKLFSLIVKDTSPPDEEEENKSIIDDYKPYDGKIIRNINITVLSPFGTDIKHPEQETKEFNFINNAHILTRESTIKNVIQFQRGAPVNPAIIMASEAQLRNANYIYDARIMIDSITGGNDSVDVKIIVRDKWTIGLDLHSLTGSKVDIEVFDKNILGSGSRGGLNFIYSSEYDRKIGYGGNYLYENVAHTNIDLEGSYLDKIKEYEWSFSATRELQPKLKYFGEASYKKNVMRPEISGWDSITPDYRERFSVTLGRAITLSDNNTIRRLALSFRYKMKLPEYHDANYQNHVKDMLLPYKYTRNKMLLMQMSLFENSYQREYMVYNFGNTEDIAQGYNISAQMGYSHFENIDDAMYSSFSASYGSSDIVKGYVYANSAISSFFNKKKPFGSVFKFDLRYFTPLMRLSGMRLRQFMSLSYSKLLNPDRYFGDRIYMGEHTTLKMRDWREGRSGVEQLLFKSETDLFSNYEIAGFRFLFYNFLDVGWITKGGKLFSSDNFNYGLGLGIRIRNNFIILNTIDLKIGFYPKLEQVGFNSFFKMGSSTPEMPPNFTPSIPEEIMLERD